MQYSFLAPHFSIQREAARALGNLAANVEYAATMVEAGVLSRLAVCLQQRELRCKRMAIFALCNIASNGKLHADILSEPSILDVVAKESKAMLDPKCQSEMEPLALLYWSLRTSPVATRIILPFVRDT